MDDPSAVNVTDKYRSAFLVSLITYLLLDLYVFLTIWQIRRNKINQVDRPDYFLAGIFFGFFIILGILRTVMNIFLSFDAKIGHPQRFMIAVTYRSYGLL